MKNTTILGVVTFVNQLKHDAVETIAALSHADINTKIITGDNIYLGVQTALMTGMIPNDKRIIILEGNKYNPQNNSVEVLELTRSNHGEILEEKNNINNFSFSNNPDEFYAIDNDFIMVRPDDFLGERVKVFARISPENKALIVKKHRDIEQDVLRNRKGLKKWTGDCSYKVGMVGDGASDLIAIK